jgi:hypothetical protein
MLLGITKASLSTESFISSAAREGGHTRSVAGDQARFHPLQAGLDHDLSLGGYRPTFGLELGLQVLIEVGVREPELLAIETVDRTIAVFRELAFRQAHRQGVAMESVAAARAS